MGNNACCGELPGQYDSHPETNALQLLDTRGEEVTIVKQLRQGEPAPSQYEKVSSTQQNQKIISQYKQNQRKFKHPLQLTRKHIPQNEIKQPYFIKDQKAFYVGEWVDRKNATIPSGIGRLYESKYISEGELDTYLFVTDDGREILETGLHGKGRKFNKIVTIQGQFWEGVLHGKGSYQNKEKDYFYDGEWSNGMRHGKGVELTPDFTYTGDFETDLRQGKGIYHPTMQNEHKRLVEEEEKILQARYRDYDANQESLQDRLDQQKGKEQECKLKTKQFLAKFRWENPFDAAGQQTLQSNSEFMKQKRVRKFFREMYDGQFVKNEFHGAGMYTWTSGKVYKGDWKQGKMDGIGEFFWPDGVIYRGEYKNDLKHGKGQMIWCPERRWRGNWAFGLKHGYGESIDIEDEMRQSQKQSNIIQVYSKVTIVGGKWNRGVLEKEIFCQQASFEKDSYPATPEELQRFKPRKDETLNEQQQKDLNSKVNSQPKQLYQSNVVPSPKNKDPIVYYNAEQAAAGSAYNRLKDTKTPSIVIPDPQPKVYYEAELDNTKPVRINLDDQSNLKKKPQVMDEREDPSSWMKIGMLGS